MAPAGIGTDLEGIHAVEAAVGCGPRRCHSRSSAGRAGPIGRRGANRRHRPCKPGFRCRRSSRTFGSIAVDAGAAGDRCTRSADRPAVDQTGGRIRRHTRLSWCSITSRIRATSVPPLVRRSRCRHDRPRRIEPPQCPTRSDRVQGRSRRPRAPPGGGRVLHTRGAQAHGAARAVAGRTRWLGHDQHPRSRLARIGRSLVCIGAEGSGLSHLVAERCDVLAAIPMVGDTESLNASVASALVMLRGCSGARLGILTALLA